MSQAHRTPASEKKPEDFLPPKLPAVQKRVVQIVITRKSGQAEAVTVILRPGDSASIDGKTFLEY